MKTDKFNLEAFAKKYDAEVFDPDSNTDVIAEHFRRTVVQSFIAEYKKHPPKNGMETQYAVGGMLVGLVNVASSFFESTDENYAALRAGIIQMAPWAVDISRQQDNLPPLSDSN